MNRGKICVSVCAENADEFIEKIKRAAEFADVIELRFDCLETDYETLFIPLNELLENVDWKFLFTFRPKSQGGKRNLSFDQWNCFWNSGIDVLASMVDKEIELIDENNDVFSPRIICSHHILDSHNDNIIHIYQNITSNEQVEIVKIAVQANEITDSLAVWKLLEKAKSENKQLIPIAMGEAGKWTRILGLAYGSPITYASLEEGNETAPGQISAQDLIEVYRVRELNEETEIYGVIGNPVSHSLSPYMHNAAFKHHKLNSVYIPFEVSNLKEFIKRMVREETREIDWNLKGFSVTIPHKEAIMNLLDFIDEDAKKIGAVNTVKVVDGKLHGYNTDVHGFIEPLQNSYRDLNGANVGIIGSGGAARACIYGLKKEGANVTIFARNIKKAKNLSDEFGVQSSEFRVGENNFNDFDILVNTSPLGMKDSNENKTPATAEQMKNLHLVYDLVYNPFETLFMREAKSVDVPTIGGLAMLVTQGMKQFEIWTGLETPMQIMSQAALQRLR